MNDQALPSEVIRMPPGRGVSPFPRPKPDDFEPSSKEKATALENDGQTRISVFDIKTTVDEILEIREIPEFLGLLFHQDWRPQLVKLYVFHFQATNERVHDLIALAASEPKELADRVAMNGRNPLGASNRDAFDQEREDQGCLFDRQAHRSKGTLRDKPEGALARLAEPPRVAVPIPSPSNRGTAAGAAGGGVGYGGEGVHGFSDLELV